MTEITGRERLYLDHAATSPLRPEVWRAMEAELDECFNPASAHAFGRRAHRCLEMARGRIAELLECNRTELYFTGGGTQSDSLAILGFARENLPRSPRVFLSATEHKACLGSARRASLEGARVREIPVDSEGTVEVERLAEWLAEDPDAPTLVSVMWANNEVGTVQPIAELVDLAHRHGAVFHTDAVQAVGKVRVSLADVPADLLTATAHKLGGPVGIGLLYCRRGIELEPLSYGGHQERALWPGTQNPVGAAGFAEALRLAVEACSEQAPRWRAMRERLEARITSEVPGARVHGGGAPERLPHLTNLGIPDCDAGALLVSLDLEGIAVSGGSACSSGSESGSSVLGAMGLDADEAYAAVRFSFGPDTSADGVERATDTLVRVAARLQALRV